MTRPQIIRADSIDLQNHDAPSAKDHRHSNFRSTSNAKTNGPLAPHQAETIREVEEERAEEEGRNPRVSWVNGDGDDSDGDRDGENVRDLHQYAEDLASGIVNSLNGNKMQKQDALAIAQNGGLTVSADDEGDINPNDDDSDDDMMDKISSSPSIEDGGYTLPPVWPARVDSLRNSLMDYELPSSPVFSETRSSSPYLEPPDYPPLQLSYQRLSKASVRVSNSGHLLPGEYNEADEHDKYSNKNDFEEPPSDLDPNLPASDSDDEIENAESSEYLNEQDVQDKDSAIDLKIEDFSLERQIHAEDGPDDEVLLSPYEFLIPYIASSDEEDEEEDDFSFIDDCRFIDSGWGGECLQEDPEDIDFQFVYALHTFVATVEGQANAAKGDTMVLLDDSNSYWWLVRIVKDSSIGYLPAEHIETPTERLARLNKHRNIDLSATMLGDQSTQAKNPLITAMRRRKKTVAFAAPTYVDYFDIDYSDEEDGEDDTEAQQHEDQQQKAASKQAGTDLVGEDESAKVEPLKPRGQKQATVDIVKPEEGDQAESSTQDAARRSSDEFFDGKTERTTRNGTVRNTDSFFRDETIETKKISLTPGLLRDDDEPRVSNDLKDLRQRPSLEKDIVVPDKIRDDKKKKEKEKKEKEKKSNPIRSFFSRKDKKKSLDEDDESFGKRSMDAGAGFGDADMVEEPEDIDSSPQKGGSQRNSAKLQKQQPRGDPSPTRKPAIVLTGTGEPDRGPPLAAEGRTNNVASAPPATLRLVESEKLEDSVPQARKDEKSKSSISMVPPTSSEPKPLAVTNAKSRVQLDDFDSSADEGTVSAPTRAPPAEPKREPSDEKLLRPTLPGSFPDSYSSIPHRSEAETRVPAGERLSESPVEVSPITPSGPPALMGDTSSQEEHSPVSSPSPELVEEGNKAHRNQNSITTSTSATTTSTWNDVNLRAFFDSGSEIRDLLVVVYDDTTDVTPVGPNHPIAGSLFREQNAKLAEITTQLDNMLGDWLARKQRLRGTV